MDFCRSSVLAGLLLVVICSQAQAARPAYNYTGSAVECYKCSTVTHGAKCEDPVDTSAIPKETCPSGVCLKYIQNVENDFDQIDRGCAAAVEPLLKEKGKEEEGGCILSTGTKMIQVQICNCMSANCNGVSGLTSAVSVLLSAALLGLIAKLFQ